MLLSEPFFLLTHLIKNQWRKRASTQREEILLSHRESKNMADRVAVTDTHPLVFHAAGGKHLGRRAALHFQACERQQALLYVPVTVMWEMSILTRLGRITLRRP